MKKFLALVISVLLLVSLFCGCSTTKDLPNSSTPDSTDEVGGSNLKEGSFTGYPIETTKSLSFWYAAGLRPHSDYVSEKESPYHQWLSEFTGVDIKWVSPAVGADATQAYNLMLASNDLPDIVYTGNLPTQAETLILDGTMISLNDYIVDYAPALNSHLEQSEALKKAIKSDSGNYYNFPFIRETEWLRITGGSAINKALLDELSLEIPETIGDWDEMLYAMKDICDVPVSTYSIAQLRRMFISGFNINNSNVSLGEDGNLTTWYSADGYYDFISMLHKWYKDGIIDPDIATMDMTAFVSRITTQTVGASVYGRLTPARFAGALKERDGSFNYIGVPYPVKNKGDIQKNVYYEPIWGGNGAYITSACKNVELACRFLDYGYTDRGITTWNYGKEGESFKFVGGKPKTLDSILNSPEGATTAMMRHTCMTQSGPSIMTEAWQRQSLPDFAIQHNDVWNETSLKSAQYAWPVVSATDEENATIADLETSLTTYAGEMYIGFIMGTESLDKYDEYIKNLESMGLSKYLDIKKQQLDRYNSR